jgi:hypothetical protein
VNRFNLVSDPVNHCRIKAIGFFPHKGFARNFQQHAINVHRCLPFSSARPHGWLTGGLLPPIA